MPTKRAKERAKKDAEEGKAPSTQAGEFVREEIENLRHGGHTTKSPKQAIAIGLSEARRAGVKVPPYKGRKKKTKTTKRTPSRKARQQK